MAVAPREVRNALNDELIAALETALDVLEKDAQARVLVLAGRGPAFCAGGDLARMEKAAKMTKARSRREASRFAKLLYRLHAYSKPVVARVHGAAFAGGMGLVAASDLVIAAEEAEFALLACAASRLIPATSCWIWPAECCRSRCGKCWLRN